MNRLGLKSQTFDPWFDRPGAYVLVDGQFGSTGKGLLAGFLAKMGKGLITHATTNAGPNSGHTAYIDDHKIMTQQLPIASVVAMAQRCPIPTIINAGAIIDRDILEHEAQYYLGGMSTVFVHPCAALITAGDRANDVQTMGGIAGTGKGVGPAIARKVMRYKGNGVSGVEFLPILPPSFEKERTWDDLWDWERDVVFVETAQGYSLGINSARFYPHTTARECSVQQAIADARIPIGKVRKVVACFRTYPIRVGNTNTGNSGGCYEDQEETTWDAIGQTPEMTSVTKRVRRVFTWSRTQFRECLATNAPDVIFLNFCNYLNSKELDVHLDLMISDYLQVIGKRPDGIVLGFGPKNEDLMELEGI